MATYINSFFEKRIEQLFELATAIQQVCSAAGVEYRIVGGLAVYLYVEEREVDTGRLTKDIDIAVRREDLPKISAAASEFGLEHRHETGIDMLCQLGQPSARRAIHLVFAGEKVSRDYLEAVPPMGASQNIHGLKLIPLADLIRMKLTSFRTKDETHLKDMDEVGLISSEIEAALPPLLHERLIRMRERP